MHPTLSLPQLNIITKMIIKYFKNLANYDEFYINNKTKQLIASTELIST